MGQAMSRIITKLIPLLLSLSFCSLLFSSSSFLAFLHYFNLYVSSFTSQLFSHTIDKNCMFLLCNCLLVFVRITRSFSASNPHHHVYEDSSLHHTEDSPRSQFTQVEPEEGRDSEIAEEVEEEEEDVEKVIAEEEEEGRERGELGLSLKEQEKEDGEDSGIMEDGNGNDDDGEAEEEEKWSKNDELLIQEEKEGVEEENWRLTTEEMNKKFDDFIRRMKDDLRIEAQRQLVMV